MEKIIHKYTDSMSDDEMRDYIRFLEGELCAENNRANHILSVYRNLRRDVMTGMHPVGVRVSLSIAQKNIRNALSNNSIDKRANHFKDYPRYSPSDE